MSKSQLALSTSLPSNSSLQTSFHSGRRASAGTGPPSKATTTPRPTIRAPQRQYLTRNIRLSFDRDLRDESRFPSSARAYMPQRLDTHHGLFASGTLEVTSFNPVLGEHDEVLQ